MLFFLKSKPQWQISSSWATIIILRGVPPSPDVPKLEKHLWAQSKKLTHDGSTSINLPTTWQTDNQLTYTRKINIDIKIKNRQSTDIYEENKHKHDWDWQKGFATPGPWDRWAVFIYISCKSSKGYSRNFLFCFWDRCEHLHFLQLLGYSRNFDTSDTCFVLMWILGGGIPKERKLTLTTIT